MIISHRHRFIFIKTRKTAGTSIEAYLSRFCGGEDVVTPLNPPVEGHEPRNHLGLFNPLPELKFMLKYHDDRARPVSLHDISERLITRNRFYGHIPAVIAKSRIPRETWDGYYKFCVERNPWDKTISHYFWVKRRKGEDYDFHRYMSEGKLPLNYPIYTDYEGRTLADFVARYENLSSDLGQVFDRLGVPSEGFLSVREKASQRQDRRHYSEFFSGEHRRYVDVIADAFETEIQMHGYSYEDRA